MEYLGLLGLLLLEVTVVYYGRKAALRPEPKFPDILALLQPELKKLQAELQQEIKRGSLAPQGSLLVEHLELALPEHINPKRES